MSRHVTDHPSASSRNRTKYYAGIERRVGDRIHPMFLNAFRRAKTAEGGQRLRRYLRIDRQN